MPTALLRSTPLRRRRPAAWRLASMLALCVLAAAGPAAAWAQQRVVLTTSAGKVVLELDEAKAPKTVANFLAYVRGGHYDGTIFHRVIDGFMVQGGGFTEAMVQKPTRPPIALESRNGLSNQRGTVAMARTAVPDSASAQFFINVADNAFLDQPNARDGHGYAVFGRVVAGMDVVDRIRAVPTTRRDAFTDVPVTPIVIQKASLEAP